MTVPKTQKQPKKSAAFGGRLLVLFWGLKYSQFLEGQNKIYTYWIYLMEHMFLRSNYVLRYRFLMIFVNFRISCQIAIRRPASYHIMSGRIAIATTSLELRNQKCWVSPRPRALVWHIRTALVYDCVQLAG